MTWLEVEEFVWLEPPLLAVELVEELVVALPDPSCPVFAVEPVDVVVPAEPPEPASTCEIPPEEVVVVAVPVPVGVGVVVPVGLWVLDWLLPFPLELWPEAEVPAPVEAVFDPEPWAFVEPEVGFELVFEPVPLLAVPLEGVEVFEPLPELADDELPVVAFAVDPLDPAEVLELVVVVALAPPVEVGLGVGDGVGVGMLVPVHQFADPPVLTPVEVGEGL